MTTWAGLDNKNIVVNVLKVSDDIENPEEWLVDRLGGNWVQTYNPKDVEAGIDTERHFREAGIGMHWDADRKAFIVEKPFDSWVFDEETCQWVAPISRPGDGYLWDEENGIWVEELLETE